jgi:hypothetical protein
VRGAAIVILPHAPGFRWSRGNAPEYSADDSAAALTQVQQRTGQPQLENGERVFVTSLVRPIEAPLRANIHRLRSARILDAQGNLIRKTGMLAFGREPNPDADDGTFVAFLVDVTRPDEV